MTEIVNLRQPMPTDFFCDVEGIGMFAFAKRTLRDELRIAAEFSRLTEGVTTPTPYLETIGGWIASLKVLAVRVPHGWDPENMDPFEKDTEEKILKVYSALRTKEASFRPKPGAGVQASGPGPVGEV